MEKYYKKWKSFINEGFGPSSFPFRIYCDMDGVLVDLIGPIEEKIKKDISENQKEGFMKLLDAGIPWEELSTSEEGEKLLRFIKDTLSNTHEFWSGLPPMKDGLGLWNFISPLEPIILSRPWDRESIIGKRQWCMEKLNPAPKLSGNVIFEKDKQKYAINSETNHWNILIDDTKDNINKWAKNGGKAIMHVSTEETIVILRTIMKEFRSDNEVDEY